MKALYELFENLNDATVRMDKMLLLAGMLCDGYSLADPLQELLEDDPESLKLCFPDMPAEFAEADDTDEFKEAFVNWAYRANKWGFVVQFARPVMDWSADGESAGFSWGYYNTAWLYGDTLEEAVERGLQWASERETAEQAKPKKARTPQAA